MVLFKIMTILIADAGSTKTDWVKLTVGHDSHRDSETFSSLGISPVINDSDFIEHELNNVAGSLGRDFDAIRFFGTGIGSPERSGIMVHCLSTVFRCSDIQAFSDMTGAAIAVLGHTPGIACIMGTGSNSCHFDGKTIDRQNASLGFILDDEGGGVAFGKRLLANIFKNLAPEDVIRKFEDRYSIQVPEIVDRLYRQASPNRWIAGFMPFITDNIDHPYISELVDSQISRFCDREFSSYPLPQLTDEGVGFVGSVALIFRDRIKREFDRRGWKIRGFTAKPINRIAENINY